MTGRRIQDVVALFLFSVAMVALLSGCVTFRQIKDMVGRARVVWRDTDPDKPGDRDKDTTAERKPDTVPEKPPDQRTNTAVEVNTETSPENTAPAVKVTIDRVGSPDPVPEGFRGVVWLDTDITAWKETAILREVRVSGSTILLDYDKAKVWPTKVMLGSTKLNGNAWIFIKRGDTWYAGTWEWMRPGQTIKTKRAVSGGGHLRSSRFSDWKPESGKWYGFMVSGLVRSPKRNVKERSNVVMYKWP